MLEKTEIEMTDDLANSILVCKTAVACCGLPDGHGRFCDDAVWDDVRKCDICLRKSDCKYKEWRR